MSDQEKRLNKFISESGYSSRRGADKLIEENRVTINGVIPELGTKVQPGDVVFVDGKLIGAMPANKSDRVYIAYNKPIGITCTTELHGAQRERAHAKNVARKKAREQDEPEEPPWRPTSPHEIQAEFGNETMMLSSC